MSGPLCGRCNRGAPYDGPYDVKRQCRLCWLGANDPRYKAVYEGEPPPPPAPLPEPLPYEKWEPWVKGVAALRQEGEVGAGDTVKRLLSTLGVNWFWQKFVVKMVGDCGCEARRVRMNARYPY